MKTAYVMSAARDWQLARRFQAIVCERGYEIAADWTVDAEKAGLTDAEHAGELGEEAELRIALSCIEAASHCNLGVMVFGPRWQEGLGFILEAGIAIYSSGELHVVSPPRGSVFWRLPWVTTFDSFETWRDA